MEQEKTFIIKHSDLQKTIDCIKKRPAEKVYELLSMLLNLQEYIEKHDSKNSQKNDQIKK